MALPSPSQINELIDSIARTQKRLKPKYDACYEAGYSKPFLQDTKIKGSGVADPVGDVVVYRDWLRTRTEKAARKIAHAERELLAALALLQNGLDQIEDAAGYAHPDED